MVAAQYVWAGGVWLACLVAVGVWARGRTLRLSQGRLLVRLETDRRGHPEETGHSRWGLAGAWIAVGLAAAVTVAAATAAVVELTGGTVIDTTDPAALADLVLVPGVSDYLPLAALPYTALAVGCGVVVHEYGHLRQYDRYGVETVAVGVLLLVVAPVGAFVRRERSTRLPRLPSLVAVAGGVAANAAVACVAAAALVGFVTLVAPAVGGLPVAGTEPGSAAAAAGVSAGDRIVGVDGQAVPDRRALAAALPAGTDTATVTLRSDGVRQTVTLTGVARAGAGVTVSPGGQLLRLLSAETAPSVRHDPGLLVTLLAPPGGADPAVLVTPDATRFAAGGALPPGLTAAVVDVLVWLTLVNAAFAAVNSAPQPPVDGATVAQAATTLAFARLPGGVTRRRVRVASLIVWLALVGGVAVVLAPLELFV